MHPTFFPPSLSPSHSISLSLSFSLSLALSLLLSLSLPHTHKHILPVHLNTNFYQNLDLNVNITQVQNQGYNSFVFMLCHINDFTNLTHLTNNKPDYGYREFRRKCDSAVNWARLFSVIFAPFTLDDILIK